MFGTAKSSRKATSAKILLVDDEPDCLSIIRCRLEWCHYTICTASNGEEALRIAEEEQPDVILLDINMPVMNGLEVLERLRKNAALKDTPVVMVTALSEKQDIAAASAYGIAGYVTKPIDFPSLLQKLADIISAETPQKARGVKD
jgi:CheY-like chemotaxis protein